MYQAQKNPFSQKSETVSGQKGSHIYVQ